MKVKKLPLHSAVLVVWTDSTTRDGWRYGAEITKGKLPTIQSLGHVVDNTAEHIAIAAGLDTGNSGTASALGITLIPWGAIRAVRQLKSSDFSRVSR